MYVWSAKMPVRNAEMIIATKGMPNVISNPPGTNDWPRGRVGIEDASAVIVQVVTAVGGLGKDERPT